jgi:hypothetical protein
VTRPSVSKNSGIVSIEANHLAPLKGKFSAMARRRFQDPKPFREGHWWWITPRKDEFVDGKLERVRTRVKVCEAEISEGEARKMAAELLRPMNQGLEAIGSAMHFTEYVNSTYKDYLETKSVPTQDSYNGTLRKYLIPTFGEMPLRYITLQVLQKYFSGMANCPIGATTVLKIKEVLSSVLARAVIDECLLKNPSGQRRDSTLEGRQQKSTEAVSHPRRV